MLLYGPPGTGKTLLARACAAQTKVMYLHVHVHGYQIAPNFVVYYLSNHEKFY